MAWLTACDVKETDDTGTDTTPGDTDPDVDGDGYAASEDCDAADAAVNPGAAEVCDGADNNCDGEIDNDAADAGTWYTDADSDGYGDASTGTTLCEQPSGMITDSSDCDDTDAAINPGAVEVCDKADTDEDCSGAADDADAGVDTSTQSLFFADADADGYGDLTDAGTLYCDPPSGVTADASDCDDANDAINPGAAEECDGIDNDCDGSADAGTLGTAETCPATTCLAVLNDGSTTDGMYWLDPDDDGADPLEVYCDQTSDGGGWALLTWTGDSSVSPIGVPYPGLSICDKPPCSRGSSADDIFLTDLIVKSTQIGIGHSEKGISTYQNLEDYDYSGYYEYGSMKGFYLDTYSGSTVGCDTGGFTTGTFYVVSGPTDYDGTTMYVAQSFRYYGSSTYNDFNESSSYIWNIGAHSYCGSSGSAPGTWMGNWSTSEHEYGPYLSSTTGARAVWAR